jgi:hypothetical protein
MFSGSTELLIGWGHLQRTQLTTTRKFEMGLPLLGEHDETRLRQSGRDPTQQKRRADEFWQNR